MKRKYDAAIGLGKIPDEVLAVIDVNGLPASLENEFMRCSIVACYAFVSIDTKEGVKTSFYYTSLAGDIYKTMSDFYLKVYSGFKK